MNRYIARHGAVCGRFGRRHAVGRQPVCRHRLDDRHAVCTLPDYPSEIRAPAGSLGGVSGFQLTFADHEVHTPGDSPYVLIAMNPAALKVNLADLQPGGIIIVNEDEFTARNLAKANTTANPLSERRICSAFRVIPVAMTRLNEEAVKPRAFAAQGSGAVQELLCPGTVPVALRPSAAAGAGVADEEVPRASRRHGRQRRQPAGRLQLRRHGRVVSASSTRWRLPGCPKDAIGG